LPRVLLALTGGQKLGIALAAAAFIAFALVSSFALPRRDPSFPGRHLSLFVVVSVLFFLGMMTAMYALAREEESEAHGTEPPAAADTHEGTDTSATGDTGTGETATGGEARGDAAAGRAVFDEAGCGGCHVLEAAGSSGTIGPSLDDTQVSFDEAVEQVRDGGGGMPAFGDRLSDEEIQNVAAFVVESAGG
jgi:mono/diheme cytochrome c family protein